MWDTKRGGRSALLLLFAQPMILAAQPARAEVVAKSDIGFVVRLAAEVTAPPGEAWKTMTNPAQWWSGQHTFSGDAANLTFDPVVGGCFCETLPRPDGAPASQKPGGVQHMRVVYIEPPRAMRLVGALGPLQSEALAATMTMTVKPTDKGSRILFEYVVGGFMRYTVDEIAPAVDRMLAGQMLSLAGKLGPVAEAPVPAPKGDAPMGPPARDDELPPAAAPKTVGPLSGVEDYRLPPARSGARPPVSASASASSLAPRPSPKPVAKADVTAPAKAAPKPLAKPVPKPAGVAAAVQPAAKPASKPAAKPAVKPAPKAPNPDDEAHRDANSAFDAALGAAPAP